MSLSVPCSLQPDYPDYLSWSLTVISCHEVGGARQQIFPRRGWGGVAPGRLPPPDHAQTRVGRPNELGEGYAEWTLSQSLPPAIPAFGMTCGVGDEMVVAGGIAFERHLHRRHLHLISRRLLLVH